MNRRVSGVLIVCLTLIVLLGCCHEALHRDAADDCFICAWIVSLREMIAALLVTIPVSAGLCLLPLAIRSVIHPSGSEVPRTTPIRLHVKLTD